MKANKLEHHLERKLTYKYSHPFLYSLVFLDAEVLGSFNWLPLLVDILIALNFNI